MKNNNNNNIKGHVYTEKNRPSFRSLNFCPENFPLTSSLFVHVATHILCDMLK